MTRAERDAARGATSVRLLHVDDAHEVLETLPARSVNYHAADHEITRESGWTIDSYCSPLPAEDPGGPAPDGPWAVARRLLEAYAFADPSIIRAVYDRARPLLGRDMLLIGRFYGLRFLIGVRVVDVVDAVHEVDGRPVQVWGWAYRTLEGHLEQGEMTFQVWKRLDTGAVEFHLDRYARRGTMPNPVVWLGWKVFGRWMQMRFVRRAQRRMSALVEAELGRRAGGG